MTTAEFKKVGRLLKEVYAQLEAEALADGVDIFGEEYRMVRDALRSEVLTRLGFTLDEYRAAKEEVAPAKKVDVQKQVAEAATSLKDVADRVDALKIPEEDDLLAKAREIAKEYVVPPQIINKVVKETVVEKPTIVRETKVEQIYNNETYNDKPLFAEIGYLNDRLNNMTFPAGVDEEKLKNEMRSDFMQELQKNINVVDMPNFRKLAMGLRNDIDTLAARPSGGGGVAISGGTNSQSSGTVNFSNSNGVTFGLAANGVMTVSIAAGGAPGSISAGTTDYALGNAVFSNSNGVSFGLNGATVTATVATNYQSQGAYLTTARASNDAVGLNTALTANGVAWTVNSSGVSLNVPAFLTTAALSNHSHGVSFTSGSVAFQTLSFTNSNGISFNSGTQGIFGSHNAITTGRASTDAIGLNTAQSNVTWTVNSSGLSLDARGYAGTATTFAGANISASFTLNSVGLNMSASVAAPGAGAENNNISLLGANVSSNSTASGSTIGWSGSNLTLAGTNGSQVIISAPATSSLSAVNGFFISSNASTISMGQNKLQFFEPTPLLSTLTSTFAPGIGTWHIQPMNLPYPLESGRMNFLVSMGSTSNLLNLSNGANFASNTTGGRSLSFNHSFMAALYSRGAGANSTRFESIWSNTWGLSISHSVGVSLTAATQLTHSQQLTMNYVSQVGTNGAYTMGGIGQSHSQSTAASSVATGGLTSGRSSWQNMVSGAMLIPMGFNTSLTPGNYLLGMAWSTASTTAGTSINGASIWPQVNWMGFNNFASFSHRQFASTVSSTGSQYFMPVGIFTAASASAPVTINPRDVVSLSNNVFPYVNFMQSNFN